MLTVDILPELSEYCQISPISASTRPNPIPLCNCEICDVARKSRNLISLLWKIGCLSILWYAVNANQSRPMEQVLATNVTPRLCEITWCKWSIPVIRKLYSGGPRPLTVFLKNPTESVQFRMQTATSSSNNEIRRKFVPFVRRIFSWSSVESDIGPKLQDRLRGLFECNAHYFECTTQDGDCSMASHLFYCTNVEGHVDLWCVREEEFRSILLRPNGNLGICSVEEFTSTYEQVQAKRSQKCASIWGHVF